MVHEDLRGAQDWYRPALWAGLEYHPHNPKYPFRLQPGQCRHAGFGTPGHHQARPKFDGGDVKKCSDRIIDPSRAEKSSDRRQISRNAVIDREFSYTCGIEISCTFWP